jgi:hypothetical protein
MGTLDLSDLMDQWDGVNHLVERGRFINLIEVCMPVCVGGWG